VSVQLFPVGRVVPKSISIEHIPSSIAHSVNNAPRKMQVWGYRSETDSKAIQLDKGNCKYDISIPQTVQFCNLKENHQPVNIIQLRVLSNHGRKEYTCIYRFRVHGDLS
jgi:hypothetical protein